MRTFPIDLVWNGNVTIRFTSNNEGTVIENTGDQSQYPVGFHSDSWINAQDKYMLSEKVS